MRTHGLQKENLACTCLRELTNSFFSEPIAEGKSFRGFMFWSMTCSFSSLYRRLPMVSS